MKAFLFRLLFPTARQFLADLVYGYLLDWHSTVTAEERAAFEIRRSMARQILEMIEGPLPVKHFVRNRRLTDEEAAHYNKIREQIKEELPDLIAQHNERMAAREAQDKHE